jgi:hypothetical protein
MVLWFEIKTCHKCVMFPNHTCMHASRFPSYIATIRKNHLRNQFWTSQPIDMHYCFILTQPRVWFSNQKGDIHWLLSLFVPSEVLPMKAQELISCPALTTWAQLLSFNRTQYRVVIGLLTGHNTFRRHLYIMGLSNSPTCRKCSTEEETSVHILCEFGP